MKSKAERLKSDIVELYLDFAHSKIPAFEYHDKAMKLILQSFEEVAENRDIQCRDELLKQTHSVTFKNGYPTEAVPKGTILELPALMGNVPLNR